jgi:hypothetical protein
VAKKEHLKILKQGVEAWNKWREENPDVKPDLCNLAIYKENSEICATELNSDEDHSRLMTELMNSYKGVDLSKINLRGANLNRSVLIRATLREADLRNAKLKEANLFNACLVGSEFDGVNLQGIKLNNAELQGTVLSYTNLEKAVLSYVNLQRSWLIQVNLQEAILLCADLQGTEILSTKLQGANFSYAIVDGKTWIDETSEVDRKTDFRGVGLDSVRIHPKTKQLLEYNIRRMNWEEWYKEHWFWRWPVQLFWLISDYGISTKRVVGVFFLLAFLFAGIYMNCAYWRPPGIVSNLGVQPEIGEAAWHYFGRALVRPVYFSIVTMTTLGFGDMYANKGSIAGHVILCVQVILGYVLLGALITRFAVLFTAGGPAGKFAKQVSAE